MNNPVTLLMVIEDVKNAARNSPHIQNGPELFRQQVERLLARAEEEHAEHEEHAKTTGRNMDTWHRLTDSLVNAAIRSLETGSYLTEKPYDRDAVQKSFTERLDRLDPLIDRKWVT